jgi:cytochrome c oxidase subunit 4
MSSHVVPIRTYINVFVALMVLMMLTVIAAFMPFGRLHVPIAMGIAIAKTLLIVAYFMHLKYSNKLTWLLAGGSTLWLVILLSFLFSDFLGKGWIGAPVVPEPADGYFGGYAVPDYETPAAEGSEHHEDPANPVEHPAAA